MVVCEPEKKKIKIKIMPKLKTQVKVEGLISYFFHGPENANISTDRTEM